MTQVFEVEGRKFELITLKKTGPAIWDRVLFVVRGDSVKDILSKVQEKLGYHPHGYDGPWSAHENPTDEEGVFLTSWRCSASCD